MMQLHGFAMSPNTRRALLALEETGASYELVAVDLMTGEQRSEAYGTLNPTHRVPTLVDGEVVIWESNAIASYLAAKLPEAGLGGRDAAEVGDIARWMFMNAAHLSPAVARIFAHTIRLPEEKRSPAVVEEARGEVARCLVALEQRLATTDAWILGGRYTLADVALGPTLAVAPMLAIDLGAFPSVARWVGALAARPAWARVYR